MLVLLGPIGPNWSYSILFSPIWFTLVIFSPLWFYSVHISSIWSIMSTSVDIGPIRSTLILFGPYVHFDLNLSIGSYSIIFNSPCSHYVIFVHLATSFHLCPLRSIFMHLHISKWYVWVESTYSKSKFITKNVDLKFVISKILSIIFIVAILLLSHINVAFQFTCPAKFKWKSF